MSFREYLLWKLHQYRKAFQNLEFNEKMFFVSILFFFVGAAIVFVGDNYLLGFGMAIMLFGGFSNIFFMFTYPDYERWKRRQKNEVLVE